MGIGKIAKLLFLFVSALKSNGGRPLVSFAVECTAKVVSKLLGATVWLAQQCETPVIVKKSGFHCWTSRSDTQPNPQSKSAGP